jgi:hypothetical protein
MFNPDSVDRVAQEAQQEALTKVSIDEMVLWANQPPRVSLMDFTQAHTQEILAFTSTKIQNPHYNQYEIEKLQSTSAVGTEITDQILIEQPDQNEQNVAVHAQLMELTTLEQGKPLPILPTDNDLVHMEVLQGEADENGMFSQGAIAQAMQQGNEAGLQAMLQHYEMHAEAAKEKGTLGEGENQVKAFGKQIQEAMQQMMEMQQANQMQAMGQPMPDDTGRASGAIPQTPQVPVGAI